MNRLKLLNSDGQHPASSKPVVISVLSGKGGVGKSVIALNLAERLTSMNHRTLLVDADATCGNLHILANVPAEGGFQRFAGGLPLAECITGREGSFDLLASEMPLPGEYQADVSLSAKAIHRLRYEGTAYEYVVIDHGSGVSDSSTVIAHGSDINLLVLIPELTSIADCYGLYKYLLSANDSIDCRLLVNRTVSSDEAEYVKGKFFTVTSRFLGRIPGYAGSLSESGMVRQAVARQMTLAGLESEAPILQELTSVAQTLTDCPAATVMSTIHNPENALNETPVTADTRG